VLCFSGSRWSVVLCAVFDWSRPRSHGLSPFGLMLAEAQVDHPFLPAGRLMVFPSPLHPSRASRPCFPSRPSFKGFWFLTICSFSLK